MKVNADERTSMPKMKRGDQEIASISIHDPISVKKDGKGMLAFWNVDGVSFAKKFDPQTKVENDAQDNVAFVAQKLMREHDVVMLQDIAGNAETFCENVESLSLDESGPKKESAASQNNGFVIIWDSEKFAADQVNEDDENEKNLLNYCNQNQEEVSLIVLKNKETQKRYFFVNTRIKNESENVASIVLAHLTKVKSENPQAEVMMAGDLNSYSIPKCERPLSYYPAPLASTYNPENNKEVYSALFSSEQVAVLNKPELNEVKAVNILKYFSRLQGKAFRVEDTLKLSSSGQLHGDDKPFKAVVAIPRDGNCLFNSVAMGMISNIKQGVDFLETKSNSVLEVQQPILASFINAFTLALIDNIPILQLHVQYQPNSDFKKALTWVIEILEKNKHLDANDLFAKLQGCIKKIGDMKLESATAEIRPLVVSKQIQLAVFMYAFGVAFRDIASKKNKDLENPAALGEQTDAIELGNMFGCDVTSYFKEDGKIIPGANSSQFKDPAAAVDRKTFGSFEIFYDGDPGTDGHFDYVVSDRDKALKTLLNTLPKSDSRDQLNEAAIPEDTSLSIKPEVSITKSVSLFDSKTNFLGDEEKNQKLIEFLTGEKHGWKVKENKEVSGKLTSLTVTDAAYKNKFEIKKDEFVTSDRSEDTYRMMIIAFREHLPSEKLVMTVGSSDIKSSIEKICQELSIPAEKFSISIKGSEKELTATPSAPKPR